MIAVETHAASTGIDATILRTTKIDATTEMIGIVAIGTSGTRATIATAATTRMTATDATTETGATTRPSVVTAATTPGTGALVATTRPPSATVATTRATGETAVTTRASDGTRGTTGITGTDRVSVANTRGRAREIAVLTRPATGTSARRRGMNGLLREKSVPLHGTRPPPHGTSATAAHGPAAVATDTTITTRNPCLRLRSRRNRCV